MNKKWMIILSLLLNAVSSNLYCPKNLNVDTYIEDYLNNNPITETVSTNQLDTTPIAHQSTLKTMPQHVPVPAALPLVNTTSLTIPADKIKTFNCSFCLKSFSQLGNKKVHERIHTGEKPYKCSYCLKSFSQLGNKKAHERIHTGEEPFNCSFCLKSFYQLGNKKTHERIHTGEEPYKCSLCSKKFTQSSSRKKHEYIHTGIKPYKCLYCIKSFTQSGSKKRHERTHNK